MKFGIAIPCYKYHIPVLKRCLDSIEQQTKKPDIVIVSCSSCVREDIPIYSYSFPLEILVCNEKKNAAENRNIAGNRLLELDCSYIGFFDCDDEMHPQRIEYISNTFQFNPYIILHNYLMNSEILNPYKKYTILELEKNIISRAPTGCAWMINYPNEKLHHSQGTVKKEIFKMIKFREEKEFERKEDAIFCGDVLQKKNINIYIKNPLSKYFPEGQTYNV